MAVPNLQMTEIVYLAGIIVDLKEAFLDEDIRGKLNEVRRTTSYKSAAEVTIAISELKQRSSLSEEQEKLCGDWHSFWMHH